MTTSSSAQSFASRRTGNDAQKGAAHVEGRAAESAGPLFDPRRSPHRERQLTALEETANSLMDAFLEDYEAMGLSDVQVCERTPTDKGHLSRVKAKTAHPSQALVTFVVDHTPHRPPDYLVVLSSIAGYEPKPKPPPDVSAVFAAYRDVLIGMELDDHVRAKVERRLGVVLSRVQASEDAP